MIKLPIGESDFKTIREQQLYYVDKSLLVKEILDDASVILITRPRRFGKTLNMSMLRYFFAAQVLGESTQGLFKGLKISQLNEEILQHHGKYPVIFLTFKDVKGISFEDTYAKFCNVIREAYLEHRYLLTSPKVYEEDKIIYQTILNQNAIFANIEDALKNLSRYLFQHHGIKPIILIDEYDTPIQSAYLNNHYELIISLFRNFLGAGLKDNPYLFKAVLTGILRISRESLFSGLNNLRVYSVLNSNYGAYFGFTEIEVMHLLETYLLKNKLSDIKEWYNGYQMGDVVLYNPWSIVNCIQDVGLIKPYWVNTSDNALIKKLLLNSGIAFKEQFAALIAGKTIESFIDENFVFAALKKNYETAIWTLFLMAGYLKNVSSKRTALGVSYKLAIPNLEVRDLYKRIILEWLIHPDGLEWYATFLAQLLEGNMDAFEAGLSHILERTISVHDTALSPEMFYHGLMIGLTASLYGDPNYDVQSNRESGYGRYDFMIFSHNPEKLTLLFEFKKTDVPKNKQNREISFSILKKAAEAALIQIDQQAYFVEAKKRGAKRLLKIGIAFSGKQFGLAYAQ